MLVKATRCRMFSLVVATREVICSWLSVTSLCSLLTAVCWKKSLVHRGLSQRTNFADKRNAIQFATNAHHPIALNAPLTELLKEEYMGYEHFVLSGGNNKRPSEFIYRSAYFIAAIPVGDHAHADS